MTDDQCNAVQRVVHYIQKTVKKRQKLEAGGAEIVQKPCTGALVLCPFPKALRRSSPGPTQLKMVHSTFQSGAQTKRNPPLYNKLQGFTDMYLIKN